MPTLFAPDTPPTDPKPPAAGIRSYRADDAAQTLDSLPDAGLVPVADIPDVMGRMVGVKRMPRFAAPTSWASTAPPPASRSSATTKASIRAPPTLTAVVGLAAWKLAMYERDHEGTVAVVSEGSDKYGSAQVAVLPVIDGQRDTNDPACPGQRLQAEPT